MKVQPGALSARRSRFLGTAFPPFSKPLLRIVTAASLAGLATAPALGGSQLPTGGTVASGNVTIGTPVNGNLAITQTSNKAIINWQGFSIGQPNVVTFNNGSGATLNRVTGSAQSSIDGTLNATGSVYLLNPNGVVIGQSGVVNVGKNFVASTLGTSDSQFNASGPLTLNGNSQAAVVNLGKIGSLGGDIALVAQKTLNTGTITAPNGSIGVLAGTQVTLRDSTLDDGKFNVDVGNASNSAVNKGNISAAEAELKANGGNVYALAGNTSGVIAATGVAANDGKVFLTAGDTGSVTAQTVIAAQTSSGAGGTVETSGGKVDFTGLQVHAGNWIIDPVDLDIDAAAAATIESNLSSTDVTLKTTSTGTASSVSAGSIVNPGNGDINVNADISWSSSHSFTVSAYRDVNVNANIASSGGGNVNLQSDNSGTGTGTVTFGAGDTVSTSGAVNIFYNPSSYATPTNYSLNMSGGSQLTAYMLVNTVADLQAIGANATTLSGTYALGRNIDLSAVTFTPLGDTTTPFTGLFDGQNNVISNLAITSLGDNVGLFGELDGTVRNLSLNDPAVSGRYNVGALAGNATGLIENVSVSGGEVDGTEIVGGIVGWLHQVATSPATIDNSIANLAVDDGALSGGNLYFGGVAGVVDTGATVSNTVSRSSVNVLDNDFEIGGVAGQNLGTLTNDSFINDLSLIGVSAFSVGTATQEIGGLVGQNKGTITGGMVDVFIDLAPTSVATVGGIAGYNDGTISQSNVTGTIQTEASSASQVGGIAGMNDVDGHVSDALMTADVSSALYVGGIVGWNLGLVTTSNAGGCGCSGSVTGVYAVGGIVGQNDGDVSNSTANIPVFASDAFFTTASTGGGLVGLNNGSIETSVAMGAVDGDTILGGLVGTNAGTITQSTSTGVVTGTGDVIGGLVGKNLNGASITFSLSSGSASSSSGANDIGGLVGLNQGAISSTGSTASASGDTNTGGLVGLNDTTGTIAASYSTGAVNGNDNLGGLVGDNVGSITTSWSGDGSGSGVSGGGNATGGLVGTNEATGTITFSYSVANATGPVDVGGLIGKNLNATPGGVDNVWASGIVNFTTPGGEPAGLVGDDSGGTVSNAYWDTATTGQTVAFGLASGTETNIGSVDGSLPPGTTGSAFSQASYGYFDFTPNNHTWFILDGETRPFLQDEAWNIGSGQYIITNSHQLQLIAMDPTASYQLTGSDADIDASDTGASATTPGPNMWTASGFDPIGTFTGTFDGQGGTVDNLFIARGTTDNVGLFATIGATGTVTNLSLTRVDVTGQDNVGALTGDNFGTITGSYADGGTNTAAGVSGRNNVGGLVGTNDTGGLITQIASSLPIPSEAFVSVSATGDNVGGLAGTNALGATISDSDAGGSFVTGSDDVGGLVGTSDGTITRSYANGAVTALVSNAGGLAGQLINGATVTDSYATATVNAPLNAGGLVGSATTSTEIDRSYASGAVSGLNNIGGLVGYLFKADVNDVYALGDVTGDTGSDSVGGLIGYADRVDISYGYASGGVSGTTNVNGLVGNPADILSATGLYWDEDSTGQTSSGLASGATPVGINSTGLDAYNSTSYANLNDGNWLFVDGILGGEGTRPMLASEYSTTITNAHQLQLIATAPNASYQLGNDVEASATTASAKDVWSPEGFSPIFSFGGTLEGNGFAIEDLTIDRPTTNSQGLFDMIAPGASVMDLAMEVFTIVGQDRVGALAGTNFGNVYNNAVAGGTLTGRNYVGGLVGANRAGANLGGVFASPDPDITSNGSNVVEFTQVTGNDRVGGLVGWNAGSVGGGSTTNPEQMSIVIGSVAGADQVGGVVGWNDGLVDSVIGANLDVEGTGYGIGGLVGNNTLHASLTNSQVLPVFSGSGTVGVSSGNGIGGAVGSNAGLVSNILVQDTDVGNSTATTVGGLVGSNLASGSIDSGSVATSVNIEGLNVVGGFAGSNAGLIANSEADPSSVQGAGFVGGFVGSNLTGGMLNNDFADSDVEASGDRVGGFVGWNAGSIGQNSGSQGDVSGNNQTGGFVGWNDGTIDGASAAVDTVSSTGYGSGGFGGYNTATGTITGSTAEGLGLATVGCGCETGGVGGFIGDNSGSISGSQVLGIDVNDPTVSVIGAFAGKNEAGASIENSIVDSASSVEGGSITGGFVGSNAGSVQGSESDASVSGTSYVGGFFGQSLSTGTADHDKAKGNVTATGNYAGGFSGMNAGEIDTSSASGIVGGGSYTGGFIGLNKSTGVLDDDSFFGVFSSVSGAGNVGGLVGRNDGTIKDNSTATVSDVEGTGYAIGGLVGYNSSTATVKDSNVLGGGTGTVGLSGGGIGGLIGDNLGTVSNDDVLGVLVGNGGQTTIGGFIGKNENGANVTDGSVDNTTIVQGNNFAGGFVGSNAGAISGSESDANVTGASYVGGFAGSIVSGGSLTNDLATGSTVGSASRIGGLAGWNAGIINTSEADGSVSGASQVGGLVGWNDLTITGSAATGAVAGSVYAIGGLVGYATGTSVLNDVSASGNVDGSGGGMGGLIGNNLGSVVNAYATGSVGAAGTHTVGGLVGVNGGSLNEVYAAGQVQGAAGVGALIGTNQASGTVANGYYDTLVTGSLTSIGVNYNSAGAHPHALTAGHPPDQATSYPGFNFITHWTVQPGQTPTLQIHP